MKKSLLDYINEQLAKALVNLPIGNLPNYQEYETSLQKICKKHGIKLNGTSCEFVNGEQVAYIEEFVNNIVAVLRNKKDKSLEKTISSLEQIQNKLSDIQDKFTE